MDTATVACYDGSDEARFDAYESANVKPLHDLLLACLPASSHVLDVGCGSGRDAAFLLKHGHTVTALDASATMLAGARARHPELDGHLHHAAIPLPPGHPILARTFDAILCNAVLMHIPDAELFDSAFQLKSLLNPGGCLVLSISTNRPGLVSSRDPTGRLFRERPPEQFALLCERLGLNIVRQHQSPDGLNRGITWHTMVLEVRENSVSS